jgi:hypothetical protein
MTMRDDIDAGRKKFRDEQNKAKGRTRAVQRRQNPNKFLLWIGENIERIAPSINKIQPFIEYVKTDINNLMVKLRVKREPVSEAWDRAVERMKGKGL